jgi:hypothetical protein
MADALGNGDPSAPGFAAFWRVAWAETRGLPLGAAFADESLEETIARGEAVLAMLGEQCAVALANGDNERAAHLGAAYEDINDQLDQARDVARLHRTLRDDVNLAMGMSAVADDDAASLPQTPIGEA